MYVMVVAKADWLVPYSELSSGWEGVSMSTDVNMYRRMLISEGKPSLLGISLSCITYNNVKTNYYSGKWFVRVNLSLADIFCVDEPLANYLIVSLSNNSNYVLINYRVSFRDFCKSMDGPTNARI